MRRLFFVVVMLSAFSSAAQPYTVGTYTPNPFGGSYVSSTQPQSWVNVGDFAQSNGTVSRVSLDWDRTCTNAFKIVFLRRNSASLSNLTVVATRGPFNSVPGRNVVVLDPPVALQTGDMLGVVQLQPVTACGSVGTQAFAAPQGMTLITTGDISTSGTLGATAAYASSTLMSAIAYQAEPVLVRIVPVVGSVAGASGSFFRTSLQMFNANVYGAPITGRLVFHPAGQPASGTDPALPFSISPGRALNYDDIIAALGASGLGSLDVYTDGGAPPIVTARVFNDSGSAGTSGLSEEAVPLTAAIDVFTLSLIPIPTDLTNYRMNIGVRTITATTLNVVVYSAIGSVVKQRTGISYPANYFQQSSAADLAGITPAELPPGGYIRISVSDYPGAAIIYSSVIDNRTNDNTFRLANQVVR